jgi:hypothetical protein
MIKQPNELLDKEKRIRILIAGYPGIGKSTLGLSAPNALHIDVDFGADRIEPRYRRPFIQPQNYEEVLNDLMPVNVNGFDTLVFDTGGKLINLMAPWAIKQDPKNGKRDGSLSLAGYGAVGKEFVRLMDYCFYELDKHIVVLFHAIEEKDGDTTRLRLMVEGQTKNNVWIPMDLGGYMEMYGNDRTLGLSNCERYYAKGTRGIKGILKIPELTEKTPNDFLAKLFAQYNAKSAEEIADAESKRSLYEEAIRIGNEIIDGVTDAATATAAVPKIKAIEHALTSEKEVNVAFNKKIKKLNLFFDKVLKAYTPAPPEGKKGEK